MSNIQKYSHLQVSTVDDLARISKAMAASGMFTDVRDAAQAMVKIQAGAELGLPPFASMSGVHVIKGKPVIGAGLMSSMIDAHPDYDFEVIEQSDKVCSIKFFKNGKLRGVSTFTIEQARNAGTQNIQKFPANMLYARAMSNGAKWYCPGVFAGPVYVPEEMEEETQDVPHEDVKPEPKKKVAPSQETPPAVLARAEQLAAEDKILRDPDFLHKTTEDHGQPMPWEAAEVVVQALKQELPAGYKAPKQQPEATPATAEEMITKAQKDMLTKFLSAKEVTAAEREKMTAAIEGMTKKRASDAIIKLQETINERRKQAA